MHGNAWIVQMHIPYTNVMKNKISSSEPNLSNIELGIPCNCALLHVYSAVSWYVAAYCGKDFVVLEERRSRPEVIFIVIFK